MERPITFLAVSLLETFGLNDDNSNYIKGSFSDIVKEWVNRQDPIAVLFIACVVNFGCSWFAHADSGTEMGESKRRKEEEGHTQSFKHFRTMDLLWGLPT